MWFERRRRELVNAWLAVALCASLSGCRFADGLSLLNYETDLVVTAVVHGKTGENRFESAGGTLAIHLACLGEGEVCDADGEGYTDTQHCCAEGLYCPGKIDSKEPRYCVPNR